ncbi:tellurite resistance protein TehB [Thalassoglobus neptunius]|uniref:Tellurite resistance protein TehB n=1 Tax=Thalassoglobus neptunius TaxID=1938619 RepID=A0A5C5X800_9PLAN|nr:class I SAM-dependent methyltransferase [Thalassoglobus neptunius]TWT58042.1 tellurite resistance protein TehB [Thalassoglobus neptunius]
MAKTDRDWDQKYRSNETPWDSGIPSQELRKVLESAQLQPTTALELGCGTGTNAIYLADLGWQVEAVDCSAPALELARRKAEKAGVEVNWILSDVVRFGADRDPVDFVFDRGCYHCCRRVDLEGYLETLEAVTTAGSKMLILCGNANSTEAGGPPRVSKSEIEKEFSPLFDFLHIREFYFEDAGNVRGPLGWSVWMSRR